MRRRPNTPSTLYMHLVAGWLRARLRKVAVRDRVDDGRPHERGYVYVEFATDEQVVECPLMSLRYVLHVQSEGVCLKIACEAAACERADADLPAWRVLLRIVGTPTDPDLAAAWNTILDRADASSDGPEGRRGWGADVKRVVFYHPQAPDAKHSAANAEYRPLNHARLSRVLERLPHLGPTVDVDLDEAFDEMACVPDDQVRAAMKRAKTEERAYAASS